MELEFLPYIDGCPLKEFSFPELESITNGFSDDNLICKTQFGDIFRGELDIGHDQEFNVKSVTVKLYRGNPIMSHTNRSLYPMERIHRLEDEITFLSRNYSINTPFLPKLIAFCCQDEKIAVVYDLNTKGVLYEYLPKDSFGWDERFKVINQVSHLLQFMYNSDPPYTIGNMAARHLLFDEDMQVVMVDFGMLTGGILGDQKVKRYISFGGAGGYIDAVTLCAGPWSPRVDVYAFGVLLIELMVKYRMKDPNGYCESLVFPLQRRKSIPPGFNLVDEILRKGPCYLDTYAEELTKMAFDCICYSRRRPTIDDIIKLLSYCNRLLL